MLHRVVCALFSVLLLVGCSGNEKPSKARNDNDAGTWKTWVIASPAEIDVAPPPEEDSPEGERDHDRLHALLTGRDEEDVEEAHFWSDYPAIEPWVNLGLDLVADQGVKNPPRTARAYALTSVAVYDAVVAAAYWQNEFARPPPSVEDAVIEPEAEFSYPSEHAAMAGAASRVLAYVFPELPAERFDVLAETAARSRLPAGTNYPSDVRAGLSLGRRVADAVIERARNDGYGEPYTGKVLKGEGYWEPPPGSVALPVEPAAAQWDPWVLESGDELRPPPPPEYGSAQFVEEAKEVMRLGAELTPEQEEMTEYWAAGEGTSLPPGMWNEIALREVRAHDMSIARSARVFALLNVAQADAAIASWDAKYAYWSPRPVNAIRDLDLAKNWTSYLPTPLFPSYVSGHSTFSAAASEVLAYVFPERRDELRAMSEEAGMSRIYGGIHYRSDNVEGLRLGRAIAEKVVARAAEDGAD